MDMKKIAIFVFSFFSLNFLLAKQALAVCPVCTVAVGAGLGFSRWLGIDDAITGLWIGGLIVSMIAWNVDWFERKNIKFKFRNIITVLAYYLLTVVPLYYSGIIGNPINTLCGCKYFDKLLISIIVGSAGFWCSASWYFWLKEKNNGHAYFPYQKVVMPVVTLIILSIIFYFLTR